MVGFGALFRIKREHAGADRSWSLGSLGSSFFAFQCKRFHGNGSDLSFDLSDSQAEPDFQLHYEAAAGSNRMYGYKAAARRSGSYIHLQAAAKSH